MKSQGLARLGRDATVNYTQSGIAVANLALAFNYGRKDDQGNQPTQWVQASLWGKRAEALGPYLTKGTAIVAYLSDTHIEEFQKRDGTPGHALNARLDDLDLVPSGSRQSTPQQSTNADAYRAATTGGGKPSTSSVYNNADEPLDDDIPF